MVDWLVGWTGARDGTDGRLDFQGRLGTVSQSLTPFPFFPFSLRICLSRLSLLLSSFGFVCVYRWEGKTSKNYRCATFSSRNLFGLLVVFLSLTPPPPSSPLPLFTLLTFIIHLVIFCRPPSSSLSPSPLPIKPLSFSFLLYFFLLYFFFFAFLSYYYHYHAFPPFFFSLSLS